MTSASEATSNCPWSPTHSKPANVRAVRWVHRVWRCPRPGLLRVSLVHTQVSKNARLGYPPPEVPVASLQGTPSAARLCARVGAVHEEPHPGGICLCINRRENQATWRLAREDARGGARNHLRSRP